MYIIQTCMYMFLQVWTSFEFHKHVHTMYRFAHTGLDSCCYVYSWLRTLDEISWNVQTSMNCVCTLTYPFSFSFLICLAGPGWPVGKTGCCRVSHLFKLASLILISPQASYHPVPPPVLLGWGQAQQTQAQLQAPPRRQGGSSCSACWRRCDGANAGLVLGRCSGALLVLESALDDLGLGATTGALTPLMSS
jgi:hypothetical protein